MVRMKPVVAAIVVTMTLVTTPAGAQSSGRFTDDDRNVHRGFIEAIAELGIAQGCTSRRYCPGDPVSRGQMASFLQRALNLPEADADHFDDDEGSVHEPAINAIATAGIARGCAERKYCSSDDVSRAQMATFIAAAFDLISSQVNFFRDDGDSVHEPAINALARSGVTEGCDADFTEYCPSVTVQRDQMATFIAKALGLRSLAAPDVSLRYTTGTRGDVESDVALFRTVVDSTLNDARGWALNGAVRFEPVQSGGDLRLWLASPEAIANAADGCSRQYSCRVGDDIYINERRWREGAETYADRALTSYRAYLINHEVGHWFELGHRGCPYNGASAPVMLQQTIALEGCESRVWPLPLERAAARQRFEGTVE
jgi:hypothetical protein